MYHLKDHELIDPIKGQSTILKSNGIICHSFWKGDGSEVFKGLFVNNHNVTTLKKVFVKYFEILSIEDNKEFDEGDYLILLARKK